MLRRYLPVLALTFLPLTAAHAAGLQQAWPQPVQPIQSVEPVVQAVPQPVQSASVPAQPAAPAREPVLLAQMPGQPDLISLGLGYVDFDKGSDDPHTRSADFRLEYRWGHPLWGAQGSVLDFGIHPLAGIDVSTRSQLYGFGGFAFDFLLWRHFVVTESEAVGLWDSGDAKPLGSFIEFRSQIEGGWRFDNDVRFTAQVSHISNAGLTHRNPGEEIVGAYLHIPVHTLFGH